MAQAKSVADRTCATCKLANWHTDKEWNFTIKDHLPITFDYPHLNGTHTRNHKACNHHK